MFQPSITMCPGWPDHKWTALGTWIHTWLYNESPCVLSDPLWFDRISPLSVQISMYCISICKVQICCGFWPAGATLHSLCVILDNQAVNLSVRGNQNNPHFVEYVCSPLQANQLTLARESVDYSLWNRTHLHSHCCENEATCGADHRWM